MGLPTFTDIISLSNTEISEAIIETENKLFSLNFKKATRQNFKSHEIKKCKTSFSSTKNTFDIKITELRTKDENLIRIKIKCQNYTIQQYKVKEF
jgi:ribosomal protein L29